MTDENTLKAAKIGIIALIDEATGYQKDRAPDALYKKLKEYDDVKLNKCAKKRI